MQSFDRKIPGIEAYGRRYNEFAAAHPNWENPRRDVCAGAQRLIRLPGGVQLELAAVPAGFFRRGFFLSSNSPDRAECLVTPQSVLISRPFWMARTELTGAQYAAVMRVAPAVEGHRARRLPLWEGRGGRPLMVEGGDLPVGEDLDLADVLRFIDALNALCGLEGDRRFRLPTEAEWEHACRAFVGRRYEGEPDPGNAAWMAGNSGGVPHPVAQKAQNPLGLFDLHGNLSEWCADAYGPLEDWPPFDPIVLPASNSAPRVVRGGSFRDAVADCDSDVRASAPPTEKGHAIRLVAGP
jgi:formylglycine-generating enzyme required for sulfatase activity